jgi:hypothetical protein
LQRSLEDLLGSQQTLVPELNLESVRQERQMLEPKQAIVFIDVPFVVIVAIPAKLVEILAFILYHKN